MMTGTTMTTTYLTDVHLLCAVCHQPIKARINTCNWLRVEWIGLSGECLSCYQKAKDTRANGKISPEAELVKDEF